MIIEGEYFYKGALRLSWGFGSPNQLGAFIASAIPLVWGVTPASQTVLPSQPRPATKVRYLAWPCPAKAVFWLIEVSLWLVIGATASRGAAVAALGAAVVWSLLGLRLDRTKWKTYMVWFGLRICMCVLGLVIFSFGGRISPEFLVQDDSIGNRLILWNGASTLIAASPWTGWGVGESGNAFMQWVQPLDRLEDYKTMVNSFLHVGAERGLPALGLLSFLTLTGISWAFVSEKYLKFERMKALVWASSCVLFSWALSNVFSTLFKDGRLWVFPGLAVVLLFGSLVVTRFPAAVVLRWIGLVFGGAFLVVAGVYLLGMRSDLQHVIRLSHPSKAVTILTHGNREEKPCWGLLVDEDVLGERYGHELRRWGAESDKESGPWSLAVFDSRFKWADSKEAKAIDCWILMGESALEADSLSPEKTVIFIHPRGQLPHRWAGRGVVILNGVDEDGSRENWTQWASHKKLRIETIAGVGLDARAEWPFAYVKNFKTRR